MPEKIYKRIRLTGCSDEGYEQAIAAAVKKAGQSLHGMAWFEVVEMRGAIRDGGSIEYQASIEVAFKVD